MQLSVLIVIEPQLLQDFILSVVINVILIFVVKSSLNRISIQIFSYEHRIDFNKLVIPILISRDFFFYC